MFVEALLQRLGLLLQLLGGVGLAWVPRLSVARELAANELALLRVSKLSGRRTLSMIRRADTPPTPFAIALRQMVQDAAGDAETL